MRTILLLLVACLLLNAQPVAPQRANFSGRWRMSKEQSDFGQFSRPDMVIRVIDQHGPSLNLHTVETTDGKTHIADLVYNLNGDPTTNDRSGRQATSKAFWDGNALMIRTDTTDSKGSPIQVLEKWQLSSDGQTLTTTSDVSGGPGSKTFHAVLVCRKEG